MRPPEQAPPSAQTPRDDPAALVPLGENSAGQTSPPTRPSRSGSGSHADEPTRVSNLDPPPARAVEAFMPGLIEGYELHGEIHRGGQGIVYRATQLSTKRVVALKVLLEGAFAGESARRRFEREIELAASLDHPSIVTILDSGLSHGRYFFAMEFIDGLRLDHYFAQHKPELNQALLLFAEICDAVNFAHQRGVIHRDLKPSNILIDHENRPRVLDFGLAKSQRGAEPRETTVQVLSATGQVLGTLAYMSPEQAAGADAVDVRSDVYSLGVVFYEALLGQTPYSVAGSLGEILNRIANDDPSPPRSVRFRSRYGRQINDELETILLKSLEKDPLRRYQTAGELGRDLRRLLAGEPVEAKRASGLYILKKTLKRYKLQAAAAGLVLLMLLVFTGVLAVLYTRESRLRNEADLLRTRSVRMAEEAAASAARETDARRDAERASASARAAAEELRETLVFQKIQRGDLARARGDLGEARDSFWDAFDDNEAHAGAQWALRQYYAQSGDSGARLLTLRPYGPLALSPDGRLAAVCESPEGVSLYEVESGVVLGWWRSPGGTTALRVGDDGLVIAAGATWARIWSPASIVPLATIALGESPPPRHVLNVDGRRFLLLVEDERVRCVRVADASIVSSAALGKPLSGTPAYSGNLRLLAAPTVAGVQLIDLGPAGELRSRAHLAPLPGIHATQFLDDGRLLAAGDGVSVARIGAREQPASAWTSFAAALGKWDNLDLDETSGLLLLSARDGRVALFRDGAVIDESRIAQQGLLDARLSPGGAAFTSLDQRGAVTSWRVGGAAENMRQPITQARDGRWAVSADGSTLVMVNPGVGISAIRERRVVDVPLPRLMQMLTRAQDGSINVSGDGSRIAVRAGNRLWIIDWQAPRVYALRWMEPRVPLLRSVAISHDGSLLALCAQSEAGEQQVLALRDLNKLSVEERVANLGALPPAAGPLSFEGAALTSISFLPNQERLLCVRSNGAVLRRAADLPLGPLQPIGMLESPAVLTAINRAGTLAAFACEDSVVRVLALDRGQVTARLRSGARVAAMDFSPASDSLLLRTLDGALSLYAPTSPERIAFWPLPPQGEAPIAAWVGTNRLALSYEDTLYEHDYSALDRVLLSNRLYAAHVEAARALARNDPEAAWEQAQRIAAADVRAANSLQLALLEAALRRQETPAPERVRAALQLAPADAYLRLGHAAYDGGRYALARELLENGAQRADGQIDDYTVWRLAECNYLDGRLEQTTSELASLERSAGLTSADRRRVRLERIAALCLSGRLREARSELFAIQAQQSPGLDRNETLDSMATLLVGNYLLGTQADTQLAANIKAALTYFEERWLNYHDDVHFFAGELARNRNDLRLARERYQRCIDLARDRWPSDWARYRLAQMESSSSEAAK